MRTGIWECQLRAHMCVCVWVRRFCTQNWMNCVQYHVSCRLLCVCVYTHFQWKNYVLCVCKYSTIQRVSVYSRCVIIYSGCYIARGTLLLYVWRKLRQQVEIYVDPHDENAVCHIKHNGLLDAVDIVLIWFCTWFNLSFTTPQKIISWTNEWKTNTISHKFLVEKLKSKFSNFRMKCVLFN